MPPEQSRSIMRDKTEWNISVRADSVTPKGKIFKFHKEQLRNSHKLTTYSCFPIKNKYEAVIQLLTNIMKL
jgi:hypothetical protein